MFVVVMALRRRVETRVGRNIFAGCCVGSCVQRLEMEAGVSRVDLTRAGFGTTSSAAKTGVAPNRVCAPQTTTSYHACKNQLLLYSI